MPAKADARHDVDACIATLMRAEWEKTVEYCGRAIKSGRLKESDLASALNARCWAYFKLQNLETALADCSEAIRLLPETAGAYSNRGAVYRALGEYSKALQDYDEAVRLDPDSAITYNNRGVAYLNIGQYDRAIEDHSHALDLDPGFAGAYFNRCNAYLAKQDYERVVADCSQALRFDPHYAKALADRGAGYVGMGEYDNAIRDFDEALRLNPGDALSYWQRGVVHFYRSDLTAAEADMASSLEHDPGDLDIVLWLHLVRMRSGETSTENLAATYASIGSDAWPAPIAKYLLGQISEAELVTAAGKSGREIRTQSICAAKFFIGEQNLVAGNVPAATLRLRDVIATCPKGSTESAGAAAELARMVP